MGTLLALSTLANASDTNLNPEYVRLKIYRFAVSKSEYCTNPQVVFENAAPEYEDILLGPTLGTGSLKNGTYKCVVIEMSDRIEFAPDQNSDSGGCVLGQQAVLDICRDQDQTLSIEGQNRACVVGDEKVTIYLSTASTNDGSDMQNEGPAFTPPVNGNLAFGIKLFGALKVNGHTSGKFVVDGRGMVRDIVNDGQHKCELDAVKFGFAKK